MRHTQGPPTVCDSPSSAASGRNHEKISVTRSIVFQVVGPCKTEALQKPVPLDPCLAEALHTWRQHTSYRAADDWVFASRAARGKTLIGDSRSCEPSFVQQWLRSATRSTSDGTYFGTPTLHCCEQTERISK